MPRMLAHQAHGSRPPRGVRGGLGVCLLLAGTVGCGEGTDAPLGPATGPAPTASVGTPEVPPIDEETASQPVAPYPTPRPVSGRLRGFNLQGMYKAAWTENNVGYDEADFQLLAELGFNTARLPLDYLTYADSSDWLLFHEEALARIDRGIELGQKHGLHISLNLHGAPGYTAHGEAERFIPAAQELSLWEAEEAQEAFVTHWRMFARRYAQIAPEHLSFNLVNEPSGVGEATYLALMQRAIDAIHAVTPEREVVLDGLDYGRRLLEGLEEPRIGQSLHVYDPFSLTHWQASWIAGSDTWPEPSWPPSPLPQYLLGPDQGDRASPLVLEGDFPAGTTLELQVGRISRLVELSIRADEAEIFHQRWLPDGDETAWKQVNFRADLGFFQNLCDCAVGPTAGLPAAAARLTLEVLDGDWMSFSSIRIVRDGTTIELVPSISDWGIPQTRFALDDEGRLEVVAEPPGFEGAYDWRGRYTDWIALAASGVHVTVGEFGVYRAVPADVTAAFLEDHLRLFAEAGFDWTMWDLAGDFGIFDNARPGSTYVPLGDRTVDRALLDLLQAH